MKLLGNAVKLIDILSENRTVDSWFETAGNLLRQYQSGSLLRGDQAIQDSIPSGVYTVVHYISLGDAHNVSSYQPAFNSTTSRFQPSQAGYYFVSAGVVWASGPLAAQTGLSVYKNGFSAILGSINSAGNVSNTVSGLVYLNGTDYIDVRAFQGTGVNQLTTANNTGTFFHAFIVRPD